MPSPSNVLGLAAVRGAITVPENTAVAIARETARLLSALLQANRLVPDDVVSAVFTATADLDADFPAHAARRLGWSDVPLLCAREIPVPGALPRVVRVLLTVCKPGLERRLEPVYLGGAAALRPDLAAHGEGLGSARSDPERERLGEFGPAASPPDPAEAAASATPDARARRRIALIGLGQIGGSIALALGNSGAWLRVGHDPAERAVALARGAGAIDEIAETIEEACAGAELAVLAVPADVLPAAIDRAAEALPVGAALIDTGSARAGVTEALARAAARGVRAIGGHPLAGNEGRGFESAHADLFRGATFCLLSTGAGIPESVSALIEALGAAPLAVDPATHDRALASTSHLPYLLACAIRDAGEVAATRGLSGPGFRDMTRLARSDPGVALAYCRANAGSIAAAWHALRGDMDRRIGALMSSGSS